MLTKTMLIQHIDQLPEDFKLDDLIERLIFLAKVEEGLDQSNNKNVISTEELETRMEKWF